MDQKGLKYMKKGFWTKNTCFLRNFVFSGILGTPSPINRNGLPDKISGIGGYHLHLEKSGQF